MEMVSKFNILPLASGRPLLALLLIVEMKKFRTNSSIHNMDTKHRYQIHMLNTNLSIYQKGIYCTGIKLYK
jgi:hypothetical protein